jgi:hypothetical protein
MISPFPKDVLVASVIVVAFLSRGLLVEMVTH